MSTKRRGLKISDKELQDILKLKQEFNDTITCNYPRKGDAEDVAKVKYCSKFEKAVRRCMERNGRVYDGKEAMVFETGEVKPWRQ